MTEGPWCALAEGFLALGQTVIECGAKQHYDLLERNKQTVTAFYDLTFNDRRPRAAVARYVGDSYVHHNPDVGDGKQGFIDYFERSAERYPEKRVYFEKVIAEGNYVALCCRQEWPGELWTNIDIFRLDDDGRIVEQWNVRQAAPTQAKNANGMS